MWTKFCFTKLLLNMFVNENQLIVDCFLSLRINFCLVNWNHVNFGSYLRLKNPYLVWQSLHRKQISWFYTDVCYEVCTSKNIYTHIVEISSGAFLNFNTYNGLPIEKNGLPIVKKRPSLHKTAFAIVNNGLPLLQNGLPLKYLILLSQILCYSTRFYWISL